MAKFEPLDLGNVALTCQQPKFYSEFQIYFVFLLWLIVCINVGNKGANSEVEALSSYFGHKICEKREIKVVLSEKLFQVGEEVGF